MKCVKEKHRAPPTTKTSLPFAAIHQGTTAVGRLLTAVMHTAASFAAVIDAATFSAAAKTTAAGMENAAAVLSPTNIFREESISNVSQARARQSGVNF